MLIKGSNITLKWIIKKTVNPGLAYFDLQVTTPSGVVTYFEGSTPWATLSGLSASADGTLQRIGTYNVAEEGIYKFVIGTGGATNFTEIHTTMAIVIAQTTVVESKLTV